MAFRALHRSAQRAGAELMIAVDPEMHFLAVGGKVVAIPGCYNVSLFGVSATSNYHLMDAIAQWVLAVQRRAGAA